VKTAAMLWQSSSMSLLRRIGIFVCSTIMLICIIVQGLYFYARDGVTPDPLPLAFIVSDWVWLLLALSFFFYFKKPMVTITVGWLVFAVFAVFLERFSDEHSLAWFLYRHSLMLLFLGASHVGFLLSHRGIKKPITEQRAE
jgi:hypothetical protein